MKTGGAMFYTGYSMTAPELAIALEERGLAFGAALLVSKRCPH